MPESRPNETIRAYQSPLERIRWLAVKNCESSKTIPGYGVIALRPSDNSGQFATELRDQQIVYRGWQTDANTEGQDPALYLINGPTPIPPGNVGRASQDWPAVALHDGAADSLSIGDPCGPKAGSWYVWSNHGPFVCQGQDPTGAISTERRKLHTMIVAPAMRSSVPAYLMSTSGDPAVPTPNSYTVADGDNLPFGALQFGLVRDNFSLAPIVVEEDAYAMRVRLAGIWWISFSATIGSSNIAEGETIRVQLHINDTPVDLAASRVQTIGTYGADLIDPYYGGDPLYTYENVAASGPFQLDNTEHQYKLWTWGDDGVLLSVRNISGETIQVSDAFFGAHYLGSAREAPHGVWTGNL